MLHDVLGENLDRDIIKSDNIVVTGHKSLVVFTVHMVLLHYYMYYYWRHTTPIYIKVTFASGTTVAGVSPSYI